MSKSRLFALGPSEISILLALRFMLVVNWNAVVVSTRLLLNQATENHPKNPAKKKKKKHGNFNFPRFQSLEIILRLGQLFHCNVKFAKRFTRKWCDHSHHSKSTPDKPFPF